MFFCERKADIYGGLDSNRVKKGWSVNAVDIFRSKEWKYFEII